MDNIFIPLYADKLTPLKLVTMTISANIENEIGPQYFNLDVLSRRTPLNDTIIGIHYRDVHRGKGQGKDGIYTKDMFEFNEIDNDLEFDFDNDINSNINIKPDDKPETDETFKFRFTKDIEFSATGNFKNQCTFVINAGDKIINTKLFNNGKLVNVGCKDLSHALFTVNALLPLFTNMKGYVKYIIPANTGMKTLKELKKFFKDDLKKKFSHLIQLLIFHLNMDTNLDCFDPSCTADDSFSIFMDLCNSDPTFIKDIMYVHTIISILKCYYNESSLLENFNNVNFINLLENIIKYTNRAEGFIAYDFPAYINNDKVIKFNEKTIKTVLINKSTNCNYYINRTVLKTVLESKTQVTKCKFDKSKYPGVLAQFMTDDGKEVKIIIFNTGKINITAANTHEQIDNAFKFIEQICIENFDKLLLKCEYENKIKDYEDSFPDQHYAGVFNGQSYYLLYKTRILSNPRNVRFLHMLNIMEKYKS